MESQPQNPEFRIDPENFHPWDCYPEIGRRSEAQRNPITLLQAKLLELTKQCPKLQSWASFMQHCEGSV